MQVIQTPLQDSLLLQPTVYPDHRGFFLERWNQKRFEEATGVSPRFLQDNHSRSRQGVLRGLHYQLEQPQAKLVSVIHGAIWDVIVDLRRSSPTFGEWFGVELNDVNMQQLWIPGGFAHGFVTLSQETDILYKTTDYYRAELGQTIQWNDPTLSIDWKLRDGQSPILSENDQAGTCFQKSHYFP